MPGNHGPEPTIAPRQPPLSHAGVRRFSRGYSCQLRLYLNWYEFEPNYNCISRKVKCFLRFSGEYLAFFRFDWYNSQYCTEIGTEIIMETYRSGHNENDSKSFDPQGPGGSNPTVSATAEQALYRLLRLFYKSERAHAAAPPFPIEPVSLGFDWMKTRLFGNIVQHGAHVSKLCIACSDFF